MRQLWVVVYKTLGDNDDIEVEVVKADATEAHKIEARLNELQEQDLIDLGSIRTVKGAERLTPIGLLRVLDGIKND